MYEKAYTIKEFSEMTGVPQNTLRNWEEKLEDAFQVPRDPHENRFYTDRHLRTVELIQKWRDSDYDFSFPQIKEMLLRLREQEMEYAKGLGGHGGIEESQLGIIPVPRTGGHLQLEQVEQRLMGMEERMEAFFNRIGSMLQVQSEAIKEMVQDEIEELKKDQETRDEAFLLLAQQRIQEITNGSATSLKDSLQHFNETFTTELQQSKRELQLQWETHKEEAAKGLKEQMETQMGAWAVISKEELEVLKNRNKKKWLFW